MAQRKKGERVLGPYPHAGGWRLIVVGPGGEKSRREYESKAEAEKVKRWVERELRAAEERTISDAKKEYAMHLRDDKQNKPGSVEDTAYRLGMFFAVVDEEGAAVRGLDEATLSSITPKLGAELYDGLRRRKTKSGKPLAVDSHRNILAEARSFLKWCVGKKWIVRNPLDGWRAWGSGATEKSSSGSTKRGSGRRRRSNSRTRGRRARWPR